MALGRWREPLAALLWGALPALIAATGMSPLLQATAVVNAGLRPVVGRYLLGLRARVAQAGPAGDAPPLLIMQSNGGCVPAERAEEQAHRLVLSGPAAGVAGAVALGGQYGIRQLVSLDMGGTSLDVCLIRDGEIPTTTESWVGEERVAIKMVDIHSAGAGGGSNRHGRGGRGRDWRGGDRGGKVTGLFTPKTLGDSRWLLPAAHNM